MDYKSQLDRNKQFIDCFLDLPKKMLSFHEQVNLAEFVLHALCSEDCLNLSKAAYFVDNPDFDHFVGLAGFDKNSNSAQLSSKNSHWNKAEEFTNGMCNCDFNKKVRQVAQNSPKKSQDTESYINQLSGLLSFDHPETYVWDIKHNNHGVLLFESADGSNLDSEILNSVCLLGFCPIF